jgi:hypothetical protein
LRLAGELLHSLSRGFQHLTFDELLAQVVVGEASDVMFTVRQRFKQQSILARERIDTYKQPLCEPAGG